MFYLKIFVVLLYFLLYVVYCFCHLHCKDENNREVDWFIIYKLPKLSSGSGEKLIEGGEAYAYITSQSSKEWKLSSESILSDKSMLGQTWKVLKQNEKTATYLFYNDEPPREYKGTASGHLKGFLGFDDQSGYWIMHSIPKFGVIKRYEYPKNALKNGQCAICVSFKVAELNKICKHLLFANPKIHIKQLSNNIASKLNKDSKSLFGKRPSFVRSGTLTRKAELKSSGGHTFLSIAKASKCKEDLYKDAIVPGIQSSLWVETWRRGQGKNMNQSCDGKYTINDILSINMTVNIHGKGKHIHFKSMDDHSKWAISTTSAKNWICITDMNRKISQQKRGGGALCFQSVTVWNAFSKIISDIGECPI